MDRAVRQVGTLLGTAVGLTLVRRGVVVAKTRVVASETFTRLEAASLGAVLVTQKVPTCPP